MQRTFFRRSEYTYYIIFPAKYKSGTQKNHFFPGLYLFILEIYSQKCYINRKNMSGMRNYRRVGIIYG